MDQRSCSLPPRAACVLVALLVASFWAPMIWRSSLLNWHTQTAYTQAQLCEWPAWQEGFSSACTSGEWFYRVLERRTIKLPSTLWTHGAAHVWHSAPLYYGLLWAMHAASSALVCAIALRVFGPRVDLAVLAGLLFGLHPATAEVMVTGQFSQYVFGGFFSLLALSIALRPDPDRRLTIAFAGVLALACTSDVTFLATPVIVLLWADDRRRWWPACGVVLVLASAGHGLLHGWAPSHRSHYAVFPPVELDERLLRALLVEPVLALRRLLLLWSPASGPWSMDAPGEFEGLGPLEPDALAWLAALVAGMGWLGRRKLGGLTRLGLLPIALLLVDVCVKAGWSDVLASRWSGLRQVYVPSAFLVLAAAWALRKVARPWLMASVGIALLTWSASLSWQLRARTWERMDGDERAWLAGLAKLQPRVLPPEAIVYLFEVSDARLFSMWQGALRGVVGDARFVVVTHAGEPTSPTRFTRRDARMLELELCTDCADFLRPEQQPAWAGPAEPSESFASYLRRGGQLNMWPIFDRGVLDGRRVPLPGLEGADIRVPALDRARPVRLELRTRYALDDPRTILLVDRPGGWARVTCPARGPCEVVALAR